MTNRRAHTATAFVLFVALLTTASCSHKSSGARTFPTPQAAAVALNDAAKAKGNDALLALFGADATSLIESSDSAAAQRNREVFTVAFAEHWAIVDGESGEKVIEVGKERWPFPVPLAQDAGGWHFDVAAGRDEVLDRRIGHNELAVIRLCEAYVAAQRLYAERAHDNQPAGVYAAKFRSDPGTENGLFWVPRKGERRSPLGDLVADAAVDGAENGGSGEPQPFHGYRFRILTSQGNAPGSVKNYLQNGHLVGGFALVAWPVEYGVTGVMTFIVNQDGVVRQADLGERTAAEARGMTVYNPDASWETAVQ